MFINKIIELLLAGVMALSLMGSGAEAEPDASDIPVSSTNWGIELSVMEVTTTGLKMVCTQSGGAPSGELHTGSYYLLERLVDDKWTVVPYAVSEEITIGWTDEAWIIPMNGTVSWEVDWEWLYGKLPAGHYRIGKELTDFRETGDYDKETYYAEFEITG